MSALTAIDRRRLVSASDGLNGIDFVQVADDGLTLTVHFLNGVELRPLASRAVTVTGGEVIAAVAVLPIPDASWSADSESRLVLTLDLAQRGDASTYQLVIDSPALDPFFDHAAFRFPGAPPPGTPAPASAPPAAPPPVIDYLAKDFTSFRQALSDFSRQRYPQWVERSEADFGVMIMEALAAIGDELSYYQDQVVAEAALPTAQQRLSLIRHARLVDYEPMPATVATTLLQLDVAAAADDGATGWTIEDALRFRALHADGSLVEFEVEDPALGLAGMLAGPPPAWATVDRRWNRGALAPYWWDDSTRVLAAGSAELWVAVGDTGLTPGQQLLLDTPGESSADPPVRELVTVAATAADQDALRDVALTRVALAAPTTLDHDLALTAIAGNLVPAVQGVRQTETFAVPPAGAPSSGPLVVRLAASSTDEDPRADLRYCLQGGTVAWVATTESEEYSTLAVAPEIVLSPGPADDPGAPWGYVRWLLDAEPTDTAYTLTPERYAPALTSGTRTWWDYDGDAGTTIRFGDGRFGLEPAPGTVFTVVYRTGVGAAGNVPADTIVAAAPGQNQGPLVISATNPFPATGGADAETAEQIRVRAPQHFAAQMLRVVRDEDYENAAATLPWVLEAGTTARWTGSWATTLTSVNPAAGEEPTDAQLAQLTALLDRRRLAGTESRVIPPRYVAVDLRIGVAAEPTAFGDDVEAAVLARLEPEGAGAAAGFFAHDLWRFGQPLEPSPLLAAVQSCPGVRGVQAVTYRRRDVGGPFVSLAEPVPLPSDAILRIDNDPSRPEAGSISITVTGAR